MPRVSQKHLKPEYRLKTVKLSEYQGKMILTALITDALKAEAEWKKDGASNVEIAMGLSEYHFPFENICTAFKINAKFIDWIKARRAKEVKP